MVTRTSHAGGAGVGGLQPVRRPTFTGLAVPVLRRQCLGCSTKFRMPGDHGHARVECPNCRGTDCPTWEPAPPEPPPRRVGWLIPMLLAAAVALAVANAWLSLENERSTLTMLAERIATQTSGR